LENHAAQNKIVLVKTGGNDQLRRDRTTQAIRYLFLSLNKEISERKPTIEEQDKFIQKWLESNV
jgi:hypothetical protein